MSWLKIFAWFATAACFAFTVRSASVFARHAPRVFSILALFSLSWAVLTPYYYSANPPELLVGITGFLFAYIGVLLRAERQNPSVFQQRFTGIHEPLVRQDHFANNSQAVALWFLRFLIIPSAIPVASSIISLLFPGRNFTTGNKIIEPVIPTLLLLIGYYAIHGGIRAYSTSRIGKLLMSIILAAYALLDSLYTIVAVYCNIHAGPVTSLPPDFFRSPPIPPMDSGFLSAFICMKIVFTIAFVSLVLKERISAEDIRLPLKYKILKFLGVALPSPPAPLEPAWIGISREYRGAQQREDIYHESIKLFQADEQVAGEISRIQGYKTEWQVRGAYRDNVLVLRYWHEDSQRGSGSIVVERDMDSGDFKGCWLGYDRDKKQIGGGPYIITHDQDGENAEKRNESWLASPTYFPPVKQARGAGGP